MNNSKTILAITAGDPAGCGPEIAVKALSHPQIYEICKPLLIGDACVIQDALRITGLPARVNVVREINEAHFVPGVIDLLDIGVVDMSAHRYGEVSAVCGEAAYRAVEKAIHLAMSGAVDGTVTGPLNKEALNLAGRHYSGHTEIYAQLTGTKNYAMLLCHKNLRVAHVSTHVSLREACDRVKKARVLETIRLADHACRMLGIESPRIGVAGLNPHAGENGLFGREELDEILPAIEQAKRQGIDADGPVPPDTLFSKANGGWYDIAVAMYHDQGHIPLKVIGFRYNREKGRWDDVEGVNITLGLPIVRSSVDHGTAFDQAGLGTVSASSMINAIEYGARLARG